MRTFILILGIIILTAAGTAFLYTPVSIMIFKVTEPHFGYPIKSASGGLLIRNDLFGDGHFGAKRSGGRAHSGIDITADVGTPVYASKSGIVFRGNIPTGYGKYILIYHPDETQSMYGHLSDWAVNTGTKVTKGDIIGTVGKTGNAANKNIMAHLHFEIRSNGEPIDPASVLK